MSMKTSLSSTFNYVYICRYMHVCAGSYGGQRHKILWSWSYSLLSQRMQVLGTKQRPSEEQQALFSTAAPLLSFL